MVAKQSTTQDTVVLALDDVSLVNDTEQGAPVVV